ncbi:hypothetical protein BHE90_013682 [Fusarium euwallaceae]|uniref:Ig-like domain-containing protein n=2 Tax=Fusarium solani species complex TaxID=232080 RepID=A0A3M2RRF4_9HYPO|nr:hypothetical protein CDV36_012541 [Fusarium kuroshium]RTE71923.1 hypothetical protein BHE90_013682 [Fusarium euwallaceae]
MALINMISASAVLTLLSYFPLVTSQELPNENLILADCGIGEGPDGGATSNEAFYYNSHVWTGNGDETNKPTLMVNIPWSGQYPWTQDGVKFTMPDDQVFAVVLKPDVKDPNEAGFAYHSFDFPNPLNCYSYHKDKVYQQADGKWCSSAYVCNHHKKAYVNPAEADDDDDDDDDKSSPKPTTPEPQKTEIKGSTNADWVELYNKPASRVMATVRDVFDKESYTCDTTKRSISDKCTIKWKCSGDPATEALDKMASVFEELAKSDKFTSEREESTEVCRHPDTRPGREGSCRQYETKVDKYYKMPSTIELIMRNLPREGSGDNSNEHGSMEYTIECEASVWECALCKGIGKALSIAVPSVGFAVWVGCTAC